MKKILLGLLCLLILLSSGCQYSNNAIYEDIREKSFTKNKKSSEDISGYLDNEKRSELSGTLYIKSFNNTVTQGVVDSFRKAHPNVKVVVEITQNIFNFSREVFDNNELYFEKYQNEVSSSLISSASKYDLINITDYSTYVSSGYLQDLDEFIENDEEFNIDDYYTNILDDLRYDGKLYAFPGGFDFYYGVINKDYLGLSENYNIDDFNTINYKNSFGLFLELEKSKKIQDNIFLFRFNEPYTFINYEIKSGIDMKNPNLDTENFKEFLKTQKEMKYNFTSEMLDNDYIDQSPLLIGTTLAEYRDMGNKLYLANHYSEFLDNLKVRYPDFKEDLEEKYPEYKKELLIKYPDVLSDSIMNRNSRHTKLYSSGIVTDDIFLLNNKSNTTPIIFSDYEKKKVYGKISDTFIIPKNSKNKELAWEFIKFLVSDLEKSNIRTSGRSLVERSFFPINKNNFEYLYDSNYELENVDTNILDNHKEFLKNSFEKVEIFLVNENVNNELHKIIYDYLYYEVLTLDQATKKCQEILEIHLSE